MDNASRSERSRNAALQAALTIIARDGPGRLTLDAIARESGMSKGAVTHQFHTKEGVLKALLEQHMAYFEDFAQRFRTTKGANCPQPELAAQIATSRELTAQPHSLAFAILGVMSEEPNLLSAAREMDAEKVKAIKAEAPDPELALLRWAAARGLALTAIFGLCPLSISERTRLFDRLLDDAQWSALAKSEKPRTAARVRSK
ncbi:MAG: TetR/AcrR family transcriptional regulator [Methylovirgula sp.]